jgi:tetratricopeptide (TPR) repeat protein
MQRRYIGVLWGVVALALLVGGVLQLGPVWRVNLTNLAALDTIAGLPAFFSIPWSACTAVPGASAEKLEQHRLSGRGGSGRIVSGGVAQLNCPLALEFAANEPADHAVDAFWQGYVLARAGRPDEAVRRWEQYPTVIGRYLFKLGDQDRAWRFGTALSLCRLGTQRSPQDMDAWQCLGEAAVQLKDWATAEAAFSGKLDLQPDNANSLYWLGRVQRFAGKLDEASGTLSRALAFTQSDSSLAASVWYELGYLYLSQGKQPYALQAFERTKAIAPKFLYLKDVEAKIKALRTPE